MSRLAKKPIPISTGVTISHQGNVWTFRGPQGEVTQIVSPIISVTEEDQALRVALNHKLAERDKNAPALLGTAAALVRNALTGVSVGHKKRLELEGVGYKVQLEGKGLMFSLGFSHPVRFEAPAGIVFTIEKNIIHVAGADKAIVGKVAAEIRELKPPEPYKGKGIHYFGEVIRRKAGKKAVSAS